MRHPAWLAVPALATLLAAGAGATPADDGRVAPFRILFAQGASTPHKAGPYGERNRRAVRHMARLFADWGGHPGVRFVFVADREGTCGGVTDCRAEQLLWQRVNATAVLLRTETARYARLFRFDRLGQAFHDELRPPVTLPETPAGTAGIDLRTLVDTGVDTGTPGGGCPWHVLLYDPDLPPVLGTPDGRPAIPVAAGASVAVSEGAVVRVAGPERHARPALAVWESASRTFAAAPPSLYAVAGVALPRAALHLHLTSPTADDADMQRFSAELTGEFRRIAPPRALQGTRVARGRRRGMGDDVQLLPPGGLEPPHAQVHEAVHCRFTFLAASAAGQPR